MKLMIFAVFVSLVSYASSKVLVGEFYSSEPSKDGRCCSCCPNNPNLMCIALCCACPPKPPGKINTLEENVLDKIKNDVSVPVVEKDSIISKLTFRSTGRCPDTSGIITICNIPLDYCYSDNNCPLGYKCCPYGCNRRCLRV